MYKLSSMHVKDQNIVLIWMKGWLLFQAKEVKSNMFRLITGGYYVNMTLPFTKTPAKNSLLVVVVQMNLDHCVLLGLTVSISSPTLFDGLLDAIQVRHKEKWFQTACSSLH